MIENDNIYGYWRYCETQESEYPWPYERQEPWEGQEEFLKKLESVEKTAYQTYYRGWSTCRICEKTNGSAEFLVEDIGRWPIGYKHYIEVHNVKPPKEFIMAIQNY